MKVSDTFFSPGDSIMFKRGDVFRDGIFFRNSGNSDFPITYSAYGEGNKPLFLGSVSLEKTKDWTSLGSNLWASADDSFPFNVGFMMLGKEYIGNVGFKCVTREELNIEREYWYDTLNYRVIVYCDQNPALKYPTIEIAKSSSPYEHVIEGVTGISYIHIENLEVKYWNAHAMAFVNSTGIEIRNCALSYGGGVVYYDKMARLGNGIEFWASSKDCIIEGCRIGQCFDTGVTIQGQGTVSTVSDIYFNNNIFWGNDMANFELAFVNDQTEIENIHFENNICIGSGRGWARPQKLHQTRGWDVTTWQGYCGTFDRLYLKNNIYYNALDASYRNEFLTTITNLDSDYNYFYKPEGIIIFWEKGEIYNWKEFSDYQNASGQDANSVVTDNKFEIQHAIRKRAACEDVFFINSLLEECDSLVSGGTPGIFNLVFPEDGITLNDTVTLVWDGITGYSILPLDHYEVWIDCEHIADVPADRNSYTLTDLNIGEHNCFVLAIDNDNNWRQSSSNPIFTVKNGIPLYTLAIELGTGSGLYEEGDTIQISPANPPGKAFIEWTGDTEYLNVSETTANNRVIMPSSDISLTATYEDILYTLTVVNGTGGGTEYTYGQVVEVAANDAPDGFIFYQWTGDVEYLTMLNVPETKVIMPDSDVTITAAFKENKPLFNWNMEAVDVVLDEGEAQQDLTNINDVITGGTEPVPPGYGSVGAIFNGTDQCFLLSNSDYGDRALNGSDRDGTVYIALRPDDVSGSPFVFSLYSVVEGRQFALALEYGFPMFYFGSKNGSIYEEVKIPHTFSANEEIILALSLDASINHYTFLAWDVADDTYYSMSESDQELLGTYYSGVADLVIGGRSDLYTNWFFDGTIYWVRVYDELHSMEEMKEIIENSKTSEKMIFGVEESDVNEMFSVFPNPSNSELTINILSDITENIDVSIYNQTGEEVFHSSDEVTFPCQVDVSSFSAGIYLVKVSDGDNQEVAKIIKR